MSCIILTTLDTHLLPSVAIKPLAQSTTNKAYGTTTPNEPDQSDKLRRVLAYLKIAALPIPDELCKRLIEVVRANIDAFAASSTDLGRTSVVIPTIKIGEARPFRHKLRAISFARRQ